MQEEIWAWKGISDVKKYVSLIPLATFWTIWKETNKRAFESVECDFDRLKTRWFQILDSFVIGHPLFSLGRFENLFFFFFK